MLEHYHPPPALKVDQNLGKNYRVDEKFFTIPCNFLSFFAPSSDLKNRKERNLTA
jgi:hypothetical protein